ncbi:MAG: DUF3570 domain-containing protein [Myxococcota bacterium]
MRWRSRARAPGGAERPAPSASLRALTSAALALPGLAASVLPPATAGAEPRDEVRLHYGRYEEDDRKLPGVTSRFDPIDVDYLNVGATSSLLDRLHLSLDYYQDTWSGATPITTAPRSLFGNRASAPDGVSGATPFIEGELFFDGDLRVLESDRFGTLSGRRDRGPVHTLSSASPETRKEVDLGLEYEWDDAALGAVGGVSIEPDYLSGFGRLSGRIDFDQKRTTLELSAGFSRSEIDARFDHDAVPYIDFSAYDGDVRNRASGSPVLREKRSDWTLSAGLSRILRPSTRLETSLQLRRSEGFLANPYKVVQVAFIDPEQQFLAPPGGFYGDVHALVERRPGNRHQLTWSSRLLQDFAALDAAASLRYVLHHDDWGIDAHTLEAQWRQQLGKTWLVTPRLRYFTQGAADFYRPLVITQQAHLRIESDPDGNLIGLTPFSHALLPGEYSADHRLSGFGVLSGGIVVQKRIARAFVFELGFEYARHAGSWRLGGGGEGDFSNFDAWMLDAGLRIDFATLALGRSAGRDWILADGDAAGAAASAPGAGGEAGHGAGHVGPGAAAHAMAHAPAGVMFAHALPQAGDFMLGYRTMYMRRAGDFKRGSGEPSDPELVANACGAAGCSAVADSMSHQMHMLDLMFAPTSWLTLMAMPSYIDNEMRLRAPTGAVPDVHGNHDRHATGGFGDTRFGALLRLFHRERHHLQLGLVTSAPSGDTSVRFRRDHGIERGFLHYDMQLGSGTWDFLPSLTYLGSSGRLRFGAQATGIVRMEGEGPTGYALGDEIQVSGWGGFALTDWLAGTLRGIYTRQGRIHGRFDRPSIVRTPGDVPANAGGRLFDLGIGLELRVPRGAFEGVVISAEWLQPLAEDWNGYQLERTGTLAASVGMSF